MARAMVRSGFILLLATVFGCQSAQTTMLPGPNFNAPVITQPPAVVVPPPVVVAKASPAPRPAPVPGNVPATWIPAVNAPKRQWTYIVIHHSAGDVGGAKAFDKFHRETRGWDELGYHFVIGNGSDTGDGLIEVGSRWPKQKQGAHAKTPDNKYNEHGIGICLVGNFDNHKPSAKQISALVRIAAFMADRYNIAPANIIGHKDTGKDTDCPGSQCNIADIRRQIAKARLTMAGIAEPKPGEEMMQATR